MSSSLDDARPIKKALDEQQRTQTVVRHEHDLTRAALEGLSSDLAVVSQTLFRLFSFRVYRDESDEARQHQLEIIKDVRPARVRMWEHSAFTAMFLLEALAKCPDFKHLQLLVAHPAHASTWHRDRRIRPAVDNLRLLFSRRPDVLVEIRCYESASVCGRNFDDRFIAAGWYTFDPRPELQSPGPPVWGARNPVTIVDCSTPEGAALREGFNKAFDGRGRAPYR